MIITNKTFTVCSVDQMAVFPLGFLAVKTMQVLPLDSATDSRSQK